MPKILLILLFSVSLDETFAQNYEKYYLLCNTADSLAFAGANEQALKSYKTAFQTVDFVHSERCKDAYQLAIKTDSFIDAYEFGKMAIISSGKKESIKTRSSSFKKSEYYQFLLDSSDFYIAKYNARVNHAYIEIIDSLLFVDQYIIRKNKTYKGNYKIDKSRLPANLFDLDSSNWRYLYQCIREMGFPSEENVGLETYNKAWAILHHNLRLEENVKYHDEIFEFVKNGAYLPEDIMVWYEQFQLGVNKQTYFTTWDGNISAENLERVDQNRRKFYLKGINSFTLTKNGRKMSAKW